jgi:hypothetical protein
MSIYGLSSSPSSINLMQLSCIAHLSVTFSIGYPRINAQPPRLGRHPSCDHFLTFVDTILPPAKIRMFSLQRGSTPDTAPKISAYEASRTARRGLFNPLILGAGRDRPH